MMAARPICLTLLSEAERLADAFAWAKTGKRMAARIAMIAMTTRSSMRVNARFRSIGDKTSDINVGVGPMHSTTGLLQITGHSHQPEKRRGRALASAAPLGS